MSLPEALERAACELAEAADPIRDANGDPVRLLETLSPSVAPSVLRWLLEHEAEAAIELADEWVELEGGSELIASIDEGGLSKAARKLVRRLRHRLRSAGADLAEAEPAAPVVARLPDVEDDLGRAFVLPLDPRGARAVYWVEAHPSGGARLVEALLDELRGIVDFSVYNAGRSRVRSFMREIERNRNLPAATVTLDDARALISQTAARQPADRPLPKAYGEFRSKLGLDRVVGQRPGARAREALRAAEGDEAALEAAALLVRNQELGPWPPAVERTREIVDRFRERSEGQIIVSGATEQGRLDAAFAAAAEELFGDEFAAVTALRFAEAAYVFWRGDREADARACVAAAAAFEGPAKASNPVARALAEALLGPVQRELEAAAAAPSEPGEAENEEPALIVEPG